MSSTVGESVQYGLDTLAGDVGTREEKITEKLMLRRDPYFNFALRRENLAKTSACQRNPAQTPVALV
jgi:hypothetical protein